MEKAMKRQMWHVPHIVFSNAGEKHCWKRNTGMIAQAEAEL